MLAAIFAVLFGLSLLPGRKPLCLRFAERVSDGILPDGAETYCRRLTWVWFFLLALVTAVNIALGSCLSGPRLWVLTSALSLLVIATTFFVEKRVRDRRFSVVFHTSGSTGKSKEIVKTFESLAKEVAFHKEFYSSFWSNGQPIDQATTQTIHLLATIDPCHMYGTLWRVMLPKALGWEVDPEVILTPESLIAKMKASEKVFLVTTPSFLDRFTAYADQYDVPQNCVEIITSGAMLTKDVSQRTKSVFGLEPRQIYGSTETGGVASRRGDGLWETFAPVKVSVKGGQLLVRSPFSFKRTYLMGDAVDMAADGRSFELKGRVDRLVKINEERVNLAEMEEAIRGLGFKEAALAVLQGDRGPQLGAVLVSGSCRVGGVSALELRKLMLPIFPKGTVPKKFRIVSELPRNPQGKVLASEIVRLLESSLVDPRMWDVVKTEGEFVAKLEFEASAPYFQGHFPDAPVLPGVVQLGFAERCVRRAFGVREPLRCVKKMKFVHIIEPGRTIDLRIVRKGPAEFAYDYEREGKACSSGILAF